MFIKVDSTDGVPLYLQIAQEIKHSIAVGSVQAGDQLPSVRDIATQITVNPNTVAKAYRELESRGIVETRRGTGTFVSDETQTFSREERKKVIVKLIDKLLDEAMHLKISDEELGRLVSDRIAAFKKAREKERGD
jgi:GntR family transcriptional regulator